MTSKDRDEFWKELFGEDYESLLSETGSKPEGQSPEPETPPTELAVPKEPPPPAKTPGPEKKTPPQNTPPSGKTLPAKETRPEATPPEEDEEPEPGSEGLTAFLAAIFDKKASKAPGPGTKPAKNASKEPRQAPKPASKPEPKPISKPKTSPKPKAVPESKPAPDTEPPVRKPPVVEAQPWQPKEWPGKQSPHTSGKKSGERKPDYPMPSVSRLQREGEEEPKSAAQKKREEEFEVDFDFDEAYQDVDEKVLRRGRVKRSGCLGGILLFLFVVSVSLILASLGWKAAVDVLGLDNEEGSVEITIPRELFTTEEREVENDDGVKEMKEVEVVDIDEVARLLKEKGLIKYEWLFKLFSKFAEADTKIKAGTYQLNMNYDYRALVSGMTPKGSQKVVITITIPEGYNVHQIVELLVKNNVCDREELVETLKNYDFYKERPERYFFLKDIPLGNENRLEGFLFPDTYEVTLNSSGATVVKKFLNNFANRWTEEQQEKLDKLGYSLYDVLKVASMIEKEAGGDEDRAKIASVIYNRLEHPDVQGTNGYLQIDATIHYAMVGTSLEFSKDLESPYNTYLYPGLTPTPIANPGLASINAALEPADTNYYYYALSKSGLHEFFKTYEAHQAFVQSEDYGG